MVARLDKITQRADRPKFWGILQQCRKRVGFVLVVGGPERLGMMILMRRLHAQVSHR